MQHSEESKYYLGTYRQVPKHRILSLDGGGIYGLTEALLLKELCRRDKKFLTRGNISLFAGSSAGAINALLLAKYERPRDAIESGELEQFWENPTPWSNTDPVGRWLSFLGLTPWFSTRGATALFTRYFGQKTLGDLAQNVLISTYAWSGEEVFPNLESPWTEHPKPPSMPGKLARSIAPWAFIPPLPRPTQALLDIFREQTKHWAQYADPDPLAPEAEQGFQPEAFRTTSYRHWQPRMFTVFRPSIRPNPDENVRLADLAYATSTPLGIRAMLHGLGDGGVFNSNPAPHAYAQFMQHLRWNTLTDEDRLELMPWIHPKGSQRNSSEALLSNIRMGMLGHSTLSMLSVGDGSAIPYFWPPNTNTGWAGFFLHPANILRGAFFPPVAYLLQAGNEAANGVMRDLMGWNYSRLNPPVLETPTIAAIVMSRSPMIRRRLIDSIRRGLQKPEVQEALDVTARFMAHPYVWSKDRIWLPTPVGPINDPELDRRLETLLGDKLSSAAIFGLGASPDPNALDSPLPANWDPDSRSRATDLGPHDQRRDFRPLGT